MWIKLAIAASLVVPGGLVVAGVYLLYRKLAGRSERYRKWQESRNIERMLRDIPLRQNIWQGRREYRQ